VANEVIDASQADCMRRSVWYDITGMDYISTAFHVAHEVAPDAVLLINDYGTTESLKRACIYNVVQDLRAQGVPISGVGMQLHIDIENPPAATIEETIEMFGSLGVEVHITELDMSIYTSGTDAYATETDVPEEILIAQGYRYRDIFDVFRRQAGHIGSVTFWGMADDHTWLTNRPITRVDLPLLFDQQLQAKWAYWGIVGPSQLPRLIKQLNVAQGTPFIDARAEFLWEMLPWIQIRGTETFSASFQTRWDENHLYLFVDVEDTTRDLEDAVDVFIDENNGKTETYESDDRHYTFKFGERPPRDEVFFFVWPKPDGYRLEAAFVLSTTATIGVPLGFDLRITDGSQPDAPISWNDPTHSQDTDTSGFGTLRPVEAVKWTTVKKGTPIIDGVEDAVWARAAEITTDVWVEGTSGATATVKILWDDDNLYVFATVNDSLLSKASSNPWEQDSIEIFVDQNNAKTTSYQPDDGQYRVNYDNEVSFRGGASADWLVSATRIISGGYVVEAAVTLYDIEPQIGTVIGFDFQVNDDEDGDGARDSVVTWKDPTGQSYQNTSRLGVLKFVKCARPFWPWPFWRWPCP
jgi:endo-1,4-beta-xylanase